jgi:poly(3-hydroxybutyrate) depolymerase
VLAGLVGLALLGTAVLLALTISPEDASPYPEGLEWSEYSTDGLVPRRWSVGVPEDLGPGTHPALVSLHPLGGNRSGWAGETDLARAAVDEGFVLVVPQGLWGMWNAGQCCGPAAGFGVDDVGFLDEVMARTSDMAEVDPGHVYMAGLSNGGLMAARHLCEGDLTPAGVAAVAAVPWDFEDCSGEVPLLVSMGDADEVFPLDGGTTPMGLWASGRPSRSWDEMRSELMALHSCDGSPEVEEFDRWSRPSEPTTRWRREEGRGCTAPLRLTTVADVPHTWLWGGDWSHTREVLDFLGIREAASS